MRSAIIAGGTASRFGGKAKGLEKVGGERILTRVVQTLWAAVGTAPLLVANAPDADKWYPGLQVAKDLLAGCGSLGGIYTAVAGGDEPVLVMAWDMPFVPVDLLVALGEGADGYDVFLPESRSRRGMEPLCGVYGPSCTTAIRTALEQEDYRVVGFHQAVRVGTLPLSEVERHGDPDHLFFNINTSDDLAEAERRWRQTPG